MLDPSTPTERKLLGETHQLMQRYADTRPEFLVQTLLLAAVIWSNKLPRDTCFHITDHLISELKRKNESV